MIPLLWYCVAPRVAHILLLYLALVVEFGGGDVQLLVLLAELGQLGLQARLLQTRGVQQALEALVFRLQLTVLPQKLLVGLVQPEGGGEGHSCGTKRKQEYLHNPQ